MKRNPTLSVTPGSIPRASSVMTRRAGAVALALIAAILSIAAVGCARANPRESLASVQRRAPEGSPKLLAIYQPWFGQSSHINVGYSCHDPNVLRRQIASAKELNIRGFAVNW